MKKNEILLDLASKEYTKSLDYTRLKAKTISVEFLDYKNGELKPIMVYFKHARGAMVRYCAENNVTTLEQVKQFNVDKYMFDDKRSTEDTLVFVR